MAKKVVVCPYCGKNDMVQNVAAIVASGTVSIDASGPTSGLTFADGHVGTVGGFTTISGTTQTALAKMLMPPEKPETGWSGWSGWLQAIVVIFSLGTVTGWIVIFPLIYLWNKIRHGDPEYKIKVQNWEAAIAKWNRICYCAREHLIFDPQSNSGCPLSEMNSFLYS